MKRVSTAHGARKPKHPSVNRLSNCALPTPLTVLLGRWQACISLVVAALEKEMALEFPSLLEPRIRTVGFAYSTFPPPSQEHPMGVMAFTCSQLLTPTTRLFS